MKSLKTAYYRLSGWEKVLSGLLICFLAIKTKRNALSYDGVFKNYFLQERGKRKSTSLAYSETETHQDDKYEMKIKRELISDRSVYGRNKVIRLAVEREVKSERIVQSLAATTYHDATRTPLQWGVKINACAIVGGKSTAAVAQRRDSRTKGTVDLSLSEIVSRLN